MSDFSLKDLNQPLKHAAEKIPANYERYLWESKARNPRVMGRGERGVCEERVREDGFRIYFSGANQEVERGGRARGVLGQRRRTRGRWGDGEVGLLTERGERMFVRPRDFYSEDFENDSEQDEEYGILGGGEQKKGRDSDETFDQNQEVIGADSKEGLLSEKLSSKTVETFSYRKEESNRNKKEGTNNYEIKRNLPWKIKLEHHSSKRIQEDIRENEKKGDISLKVNELREKIGLEESYKSQKDVKYEEEEEIEEMLEDNQFVYGELDFSLSDVHALRRSLALQAKESTSKIPGLSTMQEVEEGGGGGQHPDEGVLTANERYNETRLRQIIDRVAQLSEEQQKRLLLSLENIERKCEEKREPSFLSLTLVIESNWGNDKKVGMTEVGFLGKDQEPLKIVNVEEEQTRRGLGDRREGVNIRRIIDGKKDTTKESHMWIRDFSKKEGGVKILCMVEASKVEEVKFLAVWNYNRSLDSLDVGVRAVSLWDGDILLVRGTVEKALGNVAFNPPTIIDLRSDHTEGDMTTTNTTQDSTLDTTLDEICDDDDDDECLLDKLRNVQSNTYRTKNVETGSRKGSARFGRRSEMDDCEERDQLKELVEQFEKETLGTRKSLSLEQSWTSLNHFNRSHAGRLSIDPVKDAVLNSPMLGTLLETERVRMDSTSEEFLIPELPTGRILTLNILTTWGDPHYVGLTGLEMFSASGDRVRTKRISANPSDVNILPGYGDDPRVVANLLDGVNKTRDDVHMWLAPFTAGRDHVVTIEFMGPVSLALLRVWNYNKSRIHSSRGAREVELSLDGLLIFKGEIARASGLLQGSDDDLGGVGGAEVILFTGDDHILDLIGLNDEEFAALDDGYHDPDGLDLSATLTTNELLASLALRPTTAQETTNPGTQETTNPGPHDLEQECSSSTTSVFRPFTGSRVSGKCGFSDRKCRIIRLVVAETWGALEVGLTGLELVDEEGEVVRVDVTKVTTNFGNKDSVSRLLDGVNVTRDEDHMWVAPFSRGDPEQCLEIRLSVPRRLSVLRVWNYNKSLEESYRGVRVLHVWLDSYRVSPGHGFLLRRAPGHVLYDFVQDLDLGATSPSHQEKEEEEDVQEELRSDLPCGFMYQINVFSAWDDPYYVGLNGLELYDSRGHKVELAPHQVFAHPDSVNVLTAKEERTLQSLDVRTPDKLVNGINDTYEPKNMWLAPILPGTSNKIFVVSDRPLCVSMIRLWNYSKTPSRGVRDFSIMVDDLLIYSGVLPQAPSNTISRGILPHMNHLLEVHNEHRTVLFDLQNEQLLISEKGHLLHNNDQQGQGPDVVLTNDNHIWGPPPGTKHIPKEVPNQKFRPTTSVNRDKTQWKKDRDTVALQ